MTAFTLLLLPLAFTQRTVSRLQGVIMLAAYAAYVLWLIPRSAG